MRPLGAVDSGGGGFEVTREAPRQVEVATGQSARLDELAGQEDTLAKLVHVEVSSTSGTTLQVGRCAPGSSEPVNVEALLEVRAGETLETSAWLPPGAVCLNSLNDARATLSVQGRVRRFATSALRAVRPTVVLDTAEGVGGWSGRPGAQQTLEVSLSGLGQPARVTQRLVAVTLSEAGASLEVGPCGASAQSERVRSGAVVLLDALDTLCVRPSARVDVRMTVVAVVGSRTDDVGPCQARPPVVSCGATDTLGRLNCIPGVSATPYASPRQPAGTTQYLLRITQPADHFQPDGRTFSQRVLLTLRDERAPVVLHTTGYELFEYTSDIAAHFPTNELEVEHRFYEESTPTPVDYDELTIMQSAYDSHRIVELLSPLFTGPWLSTGHSKGGMTALYHRRFFPCDVVASAPFVTPLSYGKQDARFGPWLAQLGGAQYAVCRQTLNELERGVIAGRASFAPGLRGTYSRIGSSERALWAAMSGSALWSAFQAGRQDDAREGCPAWEALAGDPDFPSYVEQYAGYAEYYADEVLEQGTLDPYSYQTQRELGSPGGNRAHLEEYGPIPTLPDDSALLFQDLALPYFEARAMPDVQRWLNEHGERFLFVYGGFDPWTAAQVEVSGQRETTKVLVPGASHGVSIEDLEEPRREEVYSTLERWLGVRRLAKRAKDVRQGELRLYRDVMHRHRL